MKKLILIAIAIFTLQLTAQKQNQQGKKSLFKDLTVEQIADLKTKKMTLLLDLTKVQQDKIHKINLDLATERKSKSKKMKNKNKVEKPSSDERYQRQMNRMDKQIAHKKEMKSILDRDQFEKWEKRKMHRMGKKRRLKNKKK